MDHNTIVIDGVERESIIVTYYDIVEKLYLHRNFKAVSDLEKTVVDLYVCARSFLSKA